MWAAGFNAGDGAAMIDDAFTRTARLNDDEKHRRGFTLFAGIKELVRE